MTETDDNTMASHIKILGILHIVFGALGILGALFLLLLFGGLAGIAGAAADLETDRAAAMGVLGVIGVICFFVLLVLSLPGLIAGIGLLKFRPWARILGIVVSAIDLIHIPLGTAIGIYGLWALLSNEGEMLFRQPPGQPVGV